MATLIKRGSLPRRIAGSHSCALGICAASAKSRMAALYLYINGIFNGYEKIFTLTSGW